MGKAIHIRQYFDHILKEVASADMEFRLQQLRYYRYGTPDNSFEAGYMADIGNQQLVVQQAEIALHVKQHNPGWLKRICYRLKGIQPELIYVIASAKDQTMTVTFTVTRVDASGKMSGEITPQEANDIHLHV